MGNEALEPVKRRKCLGSHAEELVLMFSDGQPLHAFVQWIRRRKCA